MLSKASKYAITAVLFLTNNASKEHKIGSKEIAEKLELPAPFLAKTMQELTKKGLISSVKGPHGGFYLSKKNKKHTIFEIIDCVDDITKFDQCYLGQSECSEENPCVVHYLYVPFKNQLLNKLKNKTILEMATEFAKNNNLNEIIK
jgi:Rrf2 family protein